jgi:hypothetical protein
MSTFEQIHAGELPQDADKIQLLAHVAIGGEQASSNLEEDDLLITYPALKDYRDVLNEFIAGKDIDDAKPSRTERRYASNNFTTAIGMAVLACARAATPLKNIDERSELISTFLTNNHYVSNRPNATFFLESFTDDIFSSIEIMDRLKGISSDVLSQINKRLHMGGSEAEYTLAIQIAGYDGSDPELEETFTSAHALTFLLVAAGSPIPTELKEKMNAGLYNRYVAGDILRSIIQNEDTPQNGKGKIAELLHFAGVFSKEHNNSELVERLVNTIEDWPKDQRHALRLIAGEASTTIAINLQAANNTLKGILIGTSADPISEANGAITDMVVQISRHQRPQQVAGYSKAEIMSARAQLKKSNAKRNEQAALEEPLEPTTEKDPYTLLALDPSDGAVDDQESTSFQKVREVYLDKTPSTALTTDLDNVLDYMSTLDFSTGAARGVKKLKGALRIDGTELSVFEFKPGVAPGLSMTSDRGKNMRVIFTLLENHRLGVIKICDRNQLNNILRSIGLGVGEK